MTTRMLQYVPRFDGGGETVGFGGGGNKESCPWRSLFAGFPSLFFKGKIRTHLLFVAPSGEQLALPVCWRGTSLSTISRVFGPILFYGQSVI